MALHIDINDLLRKRKIESNRIEFKAGWNPDKIYHSICAFANDRDNLGGGYVLVGVEEENGIAKRPVKGLNPNEIDKIQKEMVRYNAKISPFLSPTCRCRGSGWAQHSCHLGANRCISTLQCV